jgi:polyisoprenoid-binding protein YceI
MQPQKRIAVAEQTHWVIDPTHSTVEFAVKNLFFFVVQGSVAIREGTIVLDATDIGQASVTAVLQSSSIATKKPRRDAHLRAADFLAADRYPEIRFQSTKVERGTDRDTLRVHGSLTIKDQSREIVLDVSEIDRSRSPSGEQIAYYTATAELDRYDFGIDKLRSLIGRLLKITINVQATRMD